MRTAIGTRLKHPHVRLRIAESRMIISLFTRIIFVTRAGEMLNFEIFTLRPETIEEHKSSVSA